MLHKVRKWAGNSFKHVPRVDYAVSSVVRTRKAVKLKQKLWIPAFPEFRCGESKRKRKNNRKERDYEKNREKIIETVKKSRKENQEAKSGRGRCLRKKNENTYGGSYLKKNKLFSLTISFCEKILLNARTNWMKGGRSSSSWELYVRFVDPLYQRERKVQGQNFRFPWMNMNKY